MVALLHLAQNDFESCERGIWLFEFLERKNAALNVDGAMDEVVRRDIIRNKFPSQSFCLVTFSLS